MKKYVYRRPPDIAIRLAARRAKLVAILPTPPPLVLMGQVWM